MHNISKLVSKILLKHELFKCNIPDNDILYASAIAIASTFNNMGYNSTKT